MSKHFSPYFSFIQNLLMKCSQSQCCNGTFWITPLHFSASDSVPSISDSVTLLHLCVCHKCMYNTFSRLVFFCDTCPCSSTTKCHVNLFVYNNNNNNNKIAVSKEYLTTRHNYFRYLELTFSQLYFCSFHSNGLIF